MIYAGGSPPSCSFPISGRPYTQKALQPLTNALKEETKDSQNDTNLSPQLLSLYIPRPLL